MLNLFLSHFYHLKSSKNCEKDLFGVLNWIERLFWEKKNRCMELMNEMRQMITDDRSSRKQNSLPTPINWPSSITFRLSSLLQSSQINPWWSVSPVEINDRFPLEIGSCHSLTQLDLQHNELDALPESMGKLTNLIRLGLRFDIKHEKDAIVY